MSQKRARQIFWTIVALGCLFAAAAGFFFPTTGAIATIVRNLEVALAGFVLGRVAITILARAVGEPKRQRNR